MLLKPANRQMKEKCVEKRPSSMEGVGNGRKDELQD